MRSQNVPFSPCILIKTLPVCFVSIGEVIEKPRVDLHHGFQDVVHESDYSPGEREVGSGWE